MDLLGEPTIEYCEKAGPGFIARPFYAISNFAYFICAYLLFRKKTLLAKIFAISAFLIGLFSLIYDIKPLRITQIVDLSGMYLFAGLILTLSVVRFFKVNIKQSAIMVGFIIFVGYLLTIGLGGLSGNIIFGALILSHILLELLLFYQKKSVNFRYWFWAFIIFAFGFAIWILDYTKTFCTSFGLLNGRSIFHYAGAASVFLLYQFFASQKEKLHLQ